MLELFSNRHKLFFSPDAPTGGGAASGTVTLPEGSSKEDLADFLLKDDDEPEVIDLEEGKGKTKEKDKEKDKTPPKDKDKDTDEEVDEEETEEEETDELDELEEELQGPTEEQLELVTPVRRKEILKKYPNLFKDFPYLEKAYFREQQFTELLPTIEDARMAVEAKETLERFESDILRGNTELLLKAVKEENPQGFYKIVDNYLATLQKVDDKAFYHVMSNVTKHTIMNMVQEARRLGLGTAETPGPGAILQNAAHILNQYIFGSSEFQPPQRLSTEEKPEDKRKDNELARREQEFTQRQFETTRNDLNTRVNNAIKNTIDANIDPNKTMSDYVRRTATRDALEKLESLMSRDARFRALNDKLWEKAFQDGFTRESVDRIRSANLSKAKTLLPSVIKTARNEALRGMGRRVREDEETADNKGPIKGGRPRSQESQSERPRSSGKIKEAKDIPQGMTTLEFLNSD
jgi:hypothetical protein